MPSLDILRHRAGSKDEKEWILTEIHYVDDGKEEKCEVTIMHEGIKYTVDALQPAMEQTFRELALQLAKGTKEIILEKQKQEKEEE